MTNLSDYKSLKKVKVIVEELIEAEKVLTSSIEALRTHEKYIPIMESISVLHNNRTLVQIHINKYKRMLAKND